MCSTADGRISYDEVVLIVSENNEISDLVMYAMGLKTEQE